MHFLEQIIKSPLCNVLRDKYLWNRKYRQYEGIDFNMVSNMLSYHALTGPLKQ